MNKLEKFCKNYEVKIINDTGRYARYHPPTFFANPERADIIHQDLVDMQTEKLYTVQIPESRLKTLIEMEERVFNYHSEHRGRDMFEILMEKEREEAFYRNTNQAVANAYKTYSTMLHLAGYIKKI